MNESIRQFQFPPEEAVLDIGEAVMFLALPLTEGDGTRPERPNGGAHPEPVSLLDEPKNPTV